MNSIKNRAALIAEAAKKMNKEVYNDSQVKKIITPRHELQRQSSKVVSLEEAIKKSGLKDGMTISFHQLAPRIIESHRRARASYRAHPQWCHHPNLYFRSSWQTR